MRNVYITFISILRFIYTYIALFFCISRSCFVSFVCNVGKAWHYNEWGSNMPRPRAAENTSFEDKNKATGSLPCLGACSRESKSNQIKTNHIKSNQIKSNQIKSNQIKSNQIK